MSTNEFCKKLQELLYQVNKTVHGLLFDMNYLNKFTCYSNIYNNNTYFLNQNKKGNRYILMLKIDNVNYKAYIKWDGTNTFTITKVLVS